MSVKKRNIWSLVAATLILTVAQPTANGLDFPTTTSLYDDPALLNYKSEFFNNAPIGKIYASGVSKLKPIFEGKKQRAIDSAFGNALARIAAGKQKANAAWKKALAEIATAVGG